MRAPRIYRRSAASGGARFILGTALLVPLGVVLLLVSQLPLTGMASPARVVSADTASAILAKRPVATNLAPPPTLEPPAPTPRPTAAPATAGAEPAATPTSGGTYTVQPGDELKYIAADYNVSMRKIIAVNDIPDPDNLKIGQVLRIPVE